MSRKHDIKRQNFEKRQEEKANRVFKIVCASLLLLGLIAIIAYSVVS